MIIPIGNSGNLKRVPYIMIIIILINVISFYIVREKVNEDNERIAAAYYEYTDAMLTYLMDEEGYSFSELNSNPQYFIDRLENPDIDSTSYYFESINNKLQYYENTQSMHIFSKLGVSRTNKGFINFMTSMFTHADFFHLIGNLWFLLLLGANVEDTYGRINFLVFYLLSGIVSSAIFILSTTDTMPLIGASGAISGVMGVFMVRHFKTKIKFLYFFAPFKPLFGTFRIAAGVVLPVWFLQQIFNAMGDGGSGVAFMAHIGGFIFGLITAIAMNFLKIEEKYIAPKIEEATNLMGYSLDEQEGIDLYYKKDYINASSKLEQHFLERYNDNTFFPLFHSLIEADKPSRAAVIADLYVRKCMDDSDSSRILNLFRDINEHEYLDVLNASTLFNIAECFMRISLYDDARMLFGKIVETEKYTIIGAKTLLYLYKNDIDIQEFDRYVDEYLNSGDADVQIIVSEIKKEIK